MTDVWLTPRRGFWLGVILAAIGMLGSTVFLTAAFALGGQELASNDAVWTLQIAFGVLVPLGAAFLVASLVAGRIASIGKATGQRANDADGTSSATRRVSAGAAVAVGCALLVGGLILESPFVQLYQSSGQPPSVETDFLLVVTTLTGLMLPIGVVLVPAGWLLALLDRIPTVPGSSELGIARDSSSSAL
ncbi:hypothetical protein IWX78_000818 [Mycetocola sp. CAN_C7]|uniref:hypothetical protein n=1 Tax=Mycetocola sp. CAN_C7 TaxID=2787724 RepID=UPI0018CA5621